MGTEAEIRNWLAGRGDAAAGPSVSYKGMDDEGVHVLVLSRFGGGQPVEVSLAQVDASFFIEGLGDIPDEVDDWLTNVNTIYSDRSSMTVAQALDVLVSSPLYDESSGGASGSRGRRDLDDGDDAAMEDDEDLFVDHDDGMFGDVEATRLTADQRADLSEDKRWESVVQSSASQGSRQASQVLMREIRQLLRLKSSGVSKQALEIDMIEDSLYRWCVKIHADGFPDSCPLKHELTRFATQHPSGLAAIVMEVVFPDNYPMNPPFIRVVRPRFQMHTGHVTIGGSICMQLLTPSGWLPSVSLENVFISIMSEMIEGDGRLDLANSTRDYTVAEAKEAFNRVANRYGWLKI